MSKPIRGVPLRESWPVHTGFPRWLYVNTSGHFIDTTHLCPWRFLKDYLLIFCVEGAGVYETSNGNFEIRAGDMFVGLPEIQHSYHSDEKIGWNIWWTHFNGALAPQLLQHAGFDNNNLTLHLPQNTLARNNTVKYLRNLCRICTSGSPSMEAEASACLYELLLYLSMYREQSRRMGVGEDDELEKKLSAATEGNPQNIDEMAKRAGMSKFHFIREFRKHYNVTPWRFIMRRRVEEARELLLTTDYPVKRIAMECGFNDPNFFSSTFRKETGFSASDYRQRYSV